MFLHKIILNVQISIPTFVEAQICTLSSVQTVAALCRHRAVSLYCNSEFLRLFACKKLSYLPRTPDSQSINALGNISDCCRHSIMGLSPRHGSHAAAPITCSCGWTEVSLSPCAGHRAPTATSVLRACPYRSVIYIILRNLSSHYSLGKVPCLSVL